MGLADWVSMPVRDAGGWEQGATFCGCVVGRQTLVVCRWTSAIALGARFTLALKWKAFIRRPLLASGRMPCRACAASGGMGVLQLRRCFASRTRDSAQDDRSFATPLLRLSPCTSQRPLF